MTKLSIALVGVSSLRCTPPAIASLANVQVDLDVRLYDGNSELVDLYERFANLCLGIGWCANEVRGFTDLEAALEGARAVCLLQEHPLPDVQAKVLRLGTNASQHWPAELDEENRRGLPLQLLRWIREEDSVWPYVEENRSTPFTGWLAEHFAADAEAR